jgi:hypothetical protein
LSLLIRMYLMSRGALLQTNQRACLLCPAIKHQPDERTSPVLFVCVFTWLPLFRMLHRAILCGWLTSEAGNSPLRAAPRCVGSRILRRPGLCHPFMRCRPKLRSAVKAPTLQFSQGHTSCESNVAHVLGTSHVSNMHFHVS